MNDLSDMTDLSHTQTKRAMQSKPLYRTSSNYKPWLVSVAEHNAKPKVLIDRVAQGKRSNPTVFMSM